MNDTGNGAGRPLAGVVSAFVVLALALLGAPAASAATATSTAASTGATGARASTTYRNPVTKSFADTYADPDVVRGRDGWWYAYATSDPLKSGGTRHLIPMSKSRDLVHWQFAGDAFATLPSWADTTTPQHMASMWAPDVHYAGGQWRMYYVVTETKGTARRRPRKSTTTRSAWPRPLRRSARGPTAAAPSWARAGQGRTTTCGRSTPRWSGTSTARSTSSTARTTAGSSSSGSTRRASTGRPGDAHRHRQQVRGHVHHAQGRLLVLLRLRRQLLRGPDDRLQRRGRAVAVAHRPLRGQGRPAHRRRW